MAYEHKSSKIDIKNIAVCLYGQYRTFDATKKYIKEAFDLEGYNVDFFCSLKPYNTGYTRPAFRQKNDISNMLDRQNADSVELDRQLNSIRETLNPKMLEVYDVEMEDNLKEGAKGIVQHKVMSNFINVVMMKQSYEAEHNMTYDLVILHRYDVLVIPKHSFKSIVNILHGCDVTDPQTVNSPDKNIILTNTICRIRTEYGVGFYPNAQDMCVMATGNALDSLIYEFMNFVPSNDYSMSDTKKYYTGAPFVDTHEMLGSLARRINIPIQDVPFVDSGGGDGAVFRMQTPFRQLSRFWAPMVMPLRDSLFSDGEDPQLETWSTQELIDASIEWNKVWGSGN